MFVSFLLKISQEAYHGVILLNSTSPQSQLVRLQTKPAEALLKMCFLQEEASLRTKVMTLFTPISCQKF